MHNFCTDTNEGDPCLHIAGSAMVITLFKFGPLKLK
jgi:hypothetical protein